MREAFSGLSQIPAIVFLFEAPRNVPEATDEAYPFLLLTGRGTSSQWHTQTCTGKSAVLGKLYPSQIYVEINPVDAKRLGVAANERVRVTARRGQVSATAFVTNTVQAGHLFIPIHYAAANELTFPAFDPIHASPPAKPAQCPCPPYAIRKLPPSILVQAGSVQNNIG